MFYRRWLKRPFDFVLALLAIGALAPLGAVISVLIWLEDRRTPIFTQTRSGRNGESFTVLKFRTMPVETAEIPSIAAGQIAPTRIGKVLRRTNLDELPQFFNIALGDMSIVGPRPALIGQQALLAMRERSGAIACRPGLTGLAQINAYDGMSEQEKARYDGEYAARISMFGDLWIICQTFRYVARRPPVY